MKLAGVTLLALLVGAAAAEDSNPLGKVIELMDSLTAKLTADGDAEEKAFKEYIEWCDDTSKNAQNDIKTAATKKEELEATIAKSTSDAEAAEGKIEDLAGKIAQAEGELKDAKLVREKEASDFGAAEGELTEALSMLSRAINIIEKEMAKNPAAFVQMDVSSIDGLLKGLGAIVDAASFSNADKEKLLAFVQGQQKADDEEDAGAPDPAAYKSHSSSILDVLEDLKAKAEEQLAGLRKAESSATQNYALLKQSLEDQAAYDTKEMDEEKAHKASCDESKASATKDLATTTGLLSDTEASLASVQSSCMQMATDHDASVAGRTAELKTIAEAKKLLQETSSGAVEETYSFFQRKSASTLRTRADLKNAEVVRFVRRLAKDQHSEALAQLASKIAAITQYGAAAGEDPFVKVKGLIKDMIAKLQAEAQASADEKAYCDEQMAKTEAKKSELEDDVAKLTSKIDTKSANSARLKEEVKALQSALAALAKEQAEMDSMRAEEHAAYSKAKEDLELGLTGVRKALDLLRKYYQGGAAMIQNEDAQPAKPVFHAKAAGAGGSIIDILEVVESDFAKNLAEEETAESDAVAAYEKRTQEIKVSTALKSQDVKYKVQEFKGLDKDVNELTADRTSTNDELTAVLEYYGKVKERCIAKPETYEERAARRQAEIKGLKEALSILNDETAPSLLQHRKRPRAGVTLSA
jgi:chromosome segregation ATPase